jgi:hypothetical protein
MLSKAGDTSEDGMKMQIASQIRRKLEQKRSREAARRALQKPPLRPQKTQAEEREG